MPSVLNTQGTPSEEPLLLVGWCNNLYITTMMFVRNPAGASAPAFSFPEDPEPRRNQTATAAGPPASGSVASGHGSSPRTHWQPWSEPRTDTPGHISRPSRSGTDPAERKSSNASDDPIRRKPLPVSRSGGSASADGERGGSVRRGPLSVPLDVNVNEKVSQALMNT